MSPLVQALVMFSLGGLYTRLVGPTPAVRTVFQTKAGGLDIRQYAALFAL